MVRRKKFLVYWSEGAKDYFVEEESRIFDSEGAAYGCTVIEEFRVLADAERYRDKLRSDREKQLDSYTLRSQNE